MSPQKWLFSDLPPPCYHLSLIHLTPLPHVTGKVMTNYFWEFKYWESHLIMITEVKRDSESFKSQKQQTQQNTTSYIYIEFPKFVQEFFPYSVSSIAYMNILSYEHFLILSDGVFNGGFVCVILLLFGWKKEYQHYLTQLRINLITKNVPII